MTSQRDIRPPYDNHKIPFSALKACSNYWFKRSQHRATVLAQQVLHDVGRKF